MGHSRGVGTLSASLSPRHQSGLAYAADGDFGAGCLSRDRGGSHLSLLSKSPRSPRSPTSTNGYASPRSQLRSRRSFSRQTSQTQSVSSSRPRSGEGSRVGEREIWFAGQMSQVSAVGNMKEAFRQEKQMERQTSCEAIRLAEEVGQGRHQRKLEKRIEGRESSQENLERERVEVIDVKRQVFLKKEQQRQLSREKLKKEEDKQSMKPGIRQALAECEVDRKISSSIHNHAQRAKQLQTARETLEREQEAVRLGIEKQLAQDHARYEHRRQEVQRMQEEVRRLREEQNQHWTAVGHKPRARRAATQQQARLQADPRTGRAQGRSQVAETQQRGRRPVQSSVRKAELSPPSSARKAEPSPYISFRKAAENSPASSCRKADLSTQSSDRIGELSPQSVVRKAEQDHLREKHLLHGPGARCSAHDLIVQQLQEQKLYKARLRVQAEEQVEQRFVRSARSHSAQWDQGRPTRWGQREISLSRSEGDFTHTTRTLLSQSRRPNPA